VQAIGRQPHRALDVAQVHCERHRPEQTTLYRLVQRHAAAFIAETEVGPGRFPHPAAIPWPSWWASRQHVDVQAQRARGDALQVDGEHHLPTRIGNWNSRCISSSTALSGTSVAPKSTVRATICLTPVQEPVGR
jgi:hypothetical protein